MKHSFSAPWATSLKVISLASTIILLGIAWGLPLLAKCPPPVTVSLRILPLVLLAGCALFTVRGYEVCDGMLNVRRLVWTTRIPLRTLTDAEWRRGSLGLVLRTCGNGGLYSFTGWYYQKSLGSFRALATRTTDAVILRFNNRRPILVTPDDPARMVGVLNALKVPPQAESGRDAQASA